MVKTTAVQADWTKQKQKLEDDFEKLWESVEGIAIEVVAKTAGEMTLHEIHANQFKKFDRDWISNERDPESGPAPEG